MCRTLSQEEAVNSPNIHSTWRYAFLTALYCALHQKRAPASIPVPWGPSKGCGWWWIQGFIPKLAAFSREATGSDVNGNWGIRMWGCFPSSPFCRHIQGSTTPHHFATEMALAAVFLIPSVPEDALHGYTPSWPFSRTNLLCSAPLRIAALASRSISVVLFWKAAGPTRLCSISSM